MSARLDAVGAHGVTAGGELVSWATLRAAARQADAGLSAAYRDLLARAEAAAIAQSPIVVSHGRDRSRVWYTTSVWTEWGECAFPARSLGLVGADEGGSLPQGHLAEAEAQAIAERLRQRYPGRTVRVQAGHEVSP